MTGQAGQVVIVGAGPAGLTAALALARRGISVTVLEAGAALPEDLRATTFHPPTLDMLDELGIASALIERGNSAPVWQFRDRELGCVAAFDLSALADVTGHPYRLQCEQFILTRLLADALAQFPHACLRLGCDVDRATDTGESVRVSLTSGETLQADILVGADGGRSVIRKMLPVSFDGFTYEERLIQAGTAFDFRAAVPDLAEINYISDPEEWCVLLRVSGYWRVSFPLAPEADEVAALAEPAFRERLERLYPGAGNLELTHRKCWRIHQRVASDFRHGRIVLAGDAAHINSPHGGMGMNSAIHDAVNLAEKLGRIWNGEAGPDLLDLYTRQRRYVASEDVKLQSMRNSQLMREKNPTARRAALDQMRRTAADPALAREFLLRSSMISGLRQAEAII